MTRYLIIPLEVEVRYWSSSYVYAGTCGRREYLKKKKRRMPATPEKTLEPRSNEQCFLSPFQSANI